MDGGDLVEGDSSKGEEDVAGAVALGITLCVIVSIANVAIAIHLMPKFQGDFAYRFGALFGAIALLPLVLASLFQLSKRFRGPIGFFQVLFWSLCLKLLWSCGSLLGSL